MNPESQETYCDPTRWIRPVLLPSLVLLGLAAAAFADDPYVCAEGTPAFPVAWCVDPNGNPIEPPPAVCSSPNVVMWSDVLRPQDTDRLPADRDSTAYNGFGRPDVTSGIELFTSVDVEGSRAYVAYAAGFSVWNLDCDFETASCPQRMSIREGWLGDFYHWSAGGELYRMIWDIDATTTPNGNVLVALPADDGDIGLTVWKVPMTGVPIQLYQDWGREGEQVQMATINNRVYAFYATANTPQGTHVYDLTTVETGSPCFENTTVSTSCGVYKGTIGSYISAFYIDVLQKPGAFPKTFVVHSRANVTKGLEILEILNPAARPPVTELVFRDDFPGQFALGVAFFNFGGKDYLAAVFNMELRLYDVTACLAESARPCTSGLGPVVWSSPRTNSGVKGYLTYSESNGTPFLYLGGDQRCAMSGLRREGLYNLAGLATGAPIYEVTEGDGQAIQGGGTYVDPILGTAVDYWGDYYANNTHGYSMVSPRIGKFYGQYFLRTAGTLFDIHTFGDGPGGPPAAITVAGPNGPTYFGEPITFTANATNCAGNVYSWIPASNCVGYDPSVLGTDAQCTHIVNCTHPCDTPPCPEWDLSVGVEKVCTGADAVQSIPLAVTVEDGRPAIASFSVDSQPPAAEYPQCSVLTLDAAVSGKPDDMTWSWALAYDNGDSVLDPNTEEPMTHNGSTWELSTEGLAAADPFAVFSDGFESGGTSRWDVVVNPTPSKKAVVSQPAEKTAEDQGVVVHLTVRNTVGGVNYQASDSFPFTLTSLGPLGDPSLADPFHLGPGRFELTVSSANATEYRWEFDTNQGVVAYDWNDPEADATVEFVWDADGTYDVRVWTRNCETRDSPMGPATVTVEVTDAEEPPVLGIASFTAKCGTSNCFMGICFCATPDFEVTPAAGTDTPDSLEFDWTCTSIDGFTIEESYTAAPDADGVYRLSHPYGARCPTGNGLHRPQVRAHKNGIYSDIRSCSQQIEVP